VQKTIIIGDIHGCHSELMELCDRAAITDGDLVVSVGDLVDRGPDPGAVIDFFRARKNAVVICGNHERKHVRGVFSYSQQVTREQLGPDRYADDVRWMSTLPYHWERPDVRVVHFGLYPGVPLADVPEEVRAGTTAGEERLTKRFGRRAWWDFYEDATPVVFGHAVFPEPLIVRDRVFGIDTGACHGMRLTGLVLPDRRLVSVPAREDHWKRVRAQWQGAVRRALPWSTMTFDQIDKKLRGLRDTEIGGEGLTHVAAWAEDLRAAIPAVRERLDAEVARLVAEAGDDFGRAAAAHPAASWLQRRRAGRLSDGHLGCPSPAQLVALAHALGITLPPAPGC